MSTLRVDNITDLGDDAVVTAGVVDSGSLPAGSILQVVSVTYSTSAAVSATSYQDTGLSASITPSSASSKILVLSNQFVTMEEGGSTGGALSDIQLLRDSTAIFENTYVTRNKNSTNIGVYPAQGAITVLDSPATTSAVTYKTQTKTGVNCAFVTTSYDNSDATMTLLEVAA